MAKFSDTEINQACAKLVGKKWHEAQDAIDHGEEKGVQYLCTCGYNSIEMMFNAHCGALNPDPLNNPQDYLTLLFFCVNEWEGWGEFLYNAIENIPEDWNYGAVERGLGRLFKDQRALPEAVAKYLEENKNDTADWGYDKED